LPVAERARADLRLDLFGQACSAWWQKCLTKSLGKSAVVKELLAGGDDGSLTLFALDWVTTDGRRKQIVPGVPDADASGRAFDVPAHIDGQGESEAFLALVGALTGKDRDELEDLDDGALDELVERSGAEPLLRCAVDYEQRLALEQVRRAMKPRFAGDAKLGLARHDDQDFDSCAEHEAALRKELRRAKARAQAVAACLYATAERRQWLLG
jgi:hypothetical protein